MALHFPLLPQCLFATLFHRWKKHFPRTTVLLENSALKEKKQAFSEFGIDFWLLTDLVKHDKQAGRLWYVRESKTFIVDDYFLPMEKEGKLVVVFNEKKYKKLSQEPKGIQRLMQDLEEGNKTAKRIIFQTGELSNGSVYSREDGFKIIVQSFQSLL